AAQAALRLLLGAAGLPDGSGLLGSLGRAPRGDLGLPFGLRRPDLLLQRRLAGVEHVRPRLERLDVRAGLLDRGALLLELLALLGLDHREVGLALRAGRE